MFRDIPLKTTRTARVNQKNRCISRATEVNDVRSISNFDDILGKNPHRQHIQGYYIEIPLSDYQTLVPNGLNCPDRYGNTYDGGQFDAPLLTLEEWRKVWSIGHPNKSRPDLLVNANWFNVWESGIPDQGQKINPRIQARTYLAGLSLSDGELVSTHKVLDQHNVGLDSITFDTKTNQASVYKHAEIDSKLENDPNFYDNKNAVSGFIILKDKTNIESPTINNNHSNRVPRTGIGYKSQGEIVVVMVIHNTKREYGVTADEFANLFQELKCTDAINLDNSGSVELYYRGLNEFGKKPVTVKTKTCDAGALTERPKPNFLGFRNRKKTTFFANDDTDIPSKKSTDVKKQAKRAATDDNFTYSYYMKR